MCVRLSRKSLTTTSLPRFCLAAGNGLAVVGTRLYTFAAKNYWLPDNTIHCVDGATLRACIGAPYYHRVDSGSNVNTGLFVYRNADRYMTHLYVAPYLFSFVVGGYDTGSAAGGNHPVMACMMPSQPSAKCPGTWPYEFSTT